jgi:hypothetical protein
MTTVRAVAAAAAVLLTAGMLCIFVLLDRELAGEQSPYHR